MLQEPKSYIGNRAEFRIRKSSLTMADKAKKLSEVIYALDSVLELIYIFVLFLVLDKLNLNLFFSLMSLRKIVEGG